MFTKLYGGHGPEYLNVRMSSYWRLASFTRSSNADSSGGAAPSNGGTADPAPVVDPTQSPSLITGSPDSPAPQTTVDPSGGSSNPLG